MVTVEDDAVSIADNGAGLPAATLERSLDYPVRVSDRDPARAAEAAFDRESGEAVRPTWLKNYREAFVQYHLHPESKFHGGKYSDRGLTQRRHIKATGVEHIGKEANRWEEQFHLGEDPHAQIVYGQSGRQQKRLDRETRERIRRRGVRRVARESGLSVGLVSGIMRGERRVSERSVRRLHALLINST